MAKKRLTDVPTAKAVKQLLALRKFDSAAAEARKLTGFAPGHATSELLRECLFALARSCAERKQFADFNRAAHELEPLCLAAGPESIRSLARLLLKGLQPGEVYRLSGSLSDANTAAALRGDLADHFVRARSATGLPDDWKAAFAAILSALQHYEAKRDDDSREALQSIGLGSPFLEWKVWLRGLLAWGADDTVRALENWSRLNPERLPYRLAAPLRAAADAAWLADQPPLRERLLNQYQRLGSGGLAGQLLQLRPELAGRRGMAKAIKMAEGLLPALKAKHPQLVPHLMNAFYSTMQKRAEPEDLDKFIRVFGRMPDDPNFYKLSAQIYDGVGEVELSIKRWSDYIGWLRDGAEWPPLLKAQAIASLYRAMARLAADLDDLEADDPFAPPKKAKPKVAPPKPSFYLSKSLEASPDWEPAAADLMSAYLDEENAPAAAAFAEKYLAAHPNAAGVGRAYVEVLMEQRDYAGALEQLAPLRKANPFDADIRGLAVDCVFYCIYQFAIAGDWEVPEAILTAERELLESESAVMTGHLRYAYYKKRKRMVEAEAELQKIDPARLVHAFLLLANAQTFRGKPAEKSAATKGYKAALAAGANPAEVLALFHAYEFFITGGIEFTSQKPLLKGIVDAMLATAADPALTEDQAVELTANLGPLTTAPKFEKFAAALGKRFPNHPLFALAIVELWAAKRTAGRAPYKIVNLLRKARELAKKATDPKYKVFEERIDELNEQLDPFSTLRNMFDSFF